jgi:hypothetical protein
VQRSVIPDLDEPIYLVLHFLLPRGITSCPPSIRRNRRKRHSHIARIPMARSIRSVRTASEPFPSKNQKPISPNLSGRMSAFKRRSSPSSGRNNPSVDHCPGTSPPPLETETPTKCNKQEESLRPTICSAHFPGGVCVAIRQPPRPGWLYIETRPQDAHQTANGGGRFVCAWYDLRNVESTLRSSAELCASF